MEDTLKELQEIDPEFTKEALEELMDNEGGEEGDE